MAVKNNFPSIKPKLLLDFANTKTLDPRITFTRASAATYFDKFGVMQTAAANTARFDHNAVTGESLGLLIEEQRTNLQPYSSDFSNAVWAKTNATVTAATIVAPDGTLAGGQLVESTGTITPQLIGSVSVAVNTNNNISIYVKAVSGSAQRYVYIGAKYALNTRWGYYLFNPNTGMVINSFVDGIQDTASAPIVTPVGNGWFRLSMVFYSPLGGQTLVIGLTNTTTPTNNYTLGSYTGDGFSGIYIWGAQLEAGAFPTSYIPTVASQVTRSADAASMTGTNFSSWYRQDEGTLFAQAYSQSTFANSVDNDLVEANDGTQTNYFGTRAGLTQGYQAGQLVSVAANGVSRARNGVITASAQPTNQPPKTRLQIGAGRLYYWTPGWYKRIAYYPVRLSNTELQALTA